MITLLPSSVNGYSCPDDPGEPGRDEPRLSVNDLEGRILSEFAWGRSVLEIGTGLGVSTKWLARSARSVLTFDIDPWVAEAVAPTLPGNAHFVTALKPGEVQVAMAFVDGFHGYESVLQDIALAHSCVRPGGLMIFHDLYLKPVSQALEDSPLITGYVHVQTKCGLAVAWRE